MTTCPTLESDPTALLSGGRPALLLRLADPRPGRCAQLALLSFGRRGFRRTFGRGFGGSRCRRRPSLLLSWRTTAARFPNASQDINGSIQPVTFLS